MIGLHSHMWSDRDAGCGAVAFANGPAATRPLVERALAEPEADLADCADTAHPATLDAEPPAEWRGPCGLYRSHDRG